MFSKLRVPYTDLNQTEGISPARFFAPSGPANRRINVAGKKKGRTMNPLTQSKNTTILPVLREGGILTIVALTCLGLSSTAQAVCQEGCDIGFENTFLGDDSLGNNASGSSNTAIGDSALVFNTTGSRNTATGDNALFFNTTGNDNTASGFEALSNNTTGNNNTAIGVNALLNNNGSSNTA